MNLDEPDDHSEEVDLASVPALTAELDALVEHFKGRKLTIKQGVAIVLAFLMAYKQYRKEMAEIRNEDRSIN